MAPVKTPVSQPFLGFKKPQAHEQLRWKVLPAGGLCYDPLGGGGCGEAPLHALSRLVDETLAREHMPRLFTRQALDDFITYRDDIIHQEGLPVAGHQLAEESGREGQGHRVGGPGGLEMA